jgi:BirA family biotin operon repressor/biotin-[acetyl-CoA-carboxylase] ligase
LVGGLAILAALEQIAPMPLGLGIKWPNDVWYGENKLCGILVESLGSHTQTASTPYTDVVIGIGMNLKMPEQTKLTAAWTDLQHMLGFTPSRNALIAKMLNALVEKLSLFQTHGFSYFSANWQQYDLLMGKSVELLNANTTQSGIAQGVNEKGELCVKVGGLLKAVRYGDVSVKPE